MSFSRILKKLRCTTKQKWSPPILVLRSLACSQANSKLNNVSIIYLITHFNLSQTEHYQNAPMCSSWKILCILIITCQPLIHRKSAHDLLLIRSFCHLVVTEKILSYNKKSISKSDCGNLRECALK